MIEDLLWNLRACTFLRQCGVTPAELHDSTRALTGQSSFAQLPLRDRRLIVRHLLLRRSRFSPTDAIFIG